MFFPSIDCITLPPPSEDAEIMRNIEKSEDKLSQKFKAAVPGVIDHIFNKVKPKAGYSAGKREDSCLGGSCTVIQKPASTLFSFTIFLPFFSNLQYVKFNTSNTFWPV